MQTKINYYNEIKETLINNEIYKKVKDYSKNKNELMSYYKVGKLLVEAQGGEDRAKYGDSLIKKYSEKLTNELGKGYSARNLKYMRKFYLFQKGQTVSAQLTWSHYIEILPLNNIKEINYYIDISLTERLSVRELRKRIKENEYQRLPHKHELDKPKVNTFVKHPIIINSNRDYEKLNEKVLKRLILDDIEHFLKQLGKGFSFIGSEVPIKIGNKTYYIDLLLFNYIHNCFVVIELKIREFQFKDIGQIKGYINYVDKNIKEITNNNTFGIIICRKDDKLVIEYVSEPNIEITNFVIYS